MMIDTAPGGEPMEYKELNKKVHKAINNGYKKIILNDVCGQRFIGDALSGNLEMVINGVPGNDLGIFMDGPSITVYGNCEDHVGNTMNSGNIIVHGGAGDVIGLSARGGKIYVKEDVGYRVGIHIKEYEHKHPTIIIGGTAKSFLGEYMAGGLIIVLGLKFLPDGTITENKYPICERELGAGIHHGKIFLRTEEKLETRLGVGAKIGKMTEKDRKTIKPYLEEFCKEFNIPKNIIRKKEFKIIEPESKRPFAGNYCWQII